MNSSTDSCEQCRGRRVRISGTVAGVPACELITEQDRIVVGSDPTCALVVVDPLVPEQAMDLRHVKMHTGIKGVCRSHWMLTARPGVRMYVNHQLTRRTRVAAGDTIAIGCHQFDFDEVNDVPRDRRTNINVQDLCARLLASRSVPPAFLFGCPSHRDRRRQRQATRWTMIAASVALLLMVIFRPEVTFAPVQPPLEVVMIAQSVRMPSPDAVRSLESVERKAFQQAPPDRPADLQTQPPPLDQVEAKPLLSEVPQPDRPPPPVDLAAVTPNPGLAPVERPLENVEVSRPQPVRPSETLTRGAPQRRLSIDQASDPQVRRELAAVNVTIDDAAVAAARLPSVTAEMPRPAPAPKLDLGSEERIALLAQHQPSPLTFEQYLGARIPVVKMPEALAALNVPAGQPTVNLDGKVSDEEIAASWKSGAFRIHGPDPQPASPPTYCYVTKTNRNGKEYLYVSFVCMDNDLSQMRVGDPKGVWEDDSVELFLDTNLDRVDYFHLIVNSQGRYQARYCPNGEAGIDNRGSPWDAAPEIKTTINREAKQWDCEILIPFDRLGGTPQKGTRWAVNFTRSFRGQNNPGSAVQNWFLVYRERWNYHRPELYGVFEW